jgi:GGDEF domain-containing protein
MDTIRLEESQDVLVQTAAVVAAQRQFAQRLRQRTVPDPLTGLPVRSLLIDRLELALAAAGPETGRLAVICCTLDGLSALEEQHGQVVAETARAEAAGRLVTSVRQGDIAERIAGAFDAPLRPAPGVTCPARLTAGVALSGRASTPASLITAADEALTAVRRERQGGRHRSSEA